MKISSTCLLLATKVGGFTLREALSPAGIDGNSDDGGVTAEINRDGWVNPEDLPPMPQCIAQQDQSTWLSTMTRCTDRRCTRHFGIICTQHQWLTQLSCLSTEFSSDVVRGYLSYCSRSVLAKAQLYQWIRSMTGRTWLVDVGDANELQNLSPSALAEGYAAIDVVHRAPVCLTGSNSASLMEAFPRVMASCSFTSTTQHTGNAARPWEYNEHLRSMVALDTETVGYDLTGSSIGYGNYFDKQCFCGAFTIDPNIEPCAPPGTIESTGERLWMNATCGPAFLPHNWMAALRTTESAYISLEDWRWPECVMDIPKRVMELADQCATDACEVDFSGYCRVVRAVDRACFCRDISYDSCRGSCRIFETRIDYLYWLHKTCGGVLNWHGLPDGWHRLATPTTREMVPWQWTLKASNHSHLASMTHWESINPAKTCASTEWKLGSFALINMATVLTIFLTRREGGFPRGLQPRNWVLAGVLMAALQFLAIWFNVFLVKTNFGYEDIPVTQLMLLWCSMPRLHWLSTLRVSVQHFQAMRIAASFLCAEVILQVLSSYCMIVTINYGLEHSFYLEGMRILNRSTAAKFMYVGALLWLLLILASIPLLHATWKTMGLIGDADTNVLKQQRSEREPHTAYGTFPVQHHTDPATRKVFMRLHAVIFVSMGLWIAQWLFWSGFIGLSLHDFCPPQLPLLTAVWIAVELPIAAVGAVR